MTPSPFTWLRRRDLVTAYTLLRIVFGINFFNHGFTRLDSIPEFAQGMVDLFQDTFMPAPLVRATAFLVPIVEFLIGIGIALGLATEVALVTGIGLMAILMYGVTLLQNWDAASSQLIYCLVFFILIACRSFNDFSLDRVIAKGRDRPNS